MKDPGFTGAHRLGNRKGLWQIRRVIVASHNVMFGLRLERLLDHYRDLRDSEGLALLCVQENEPTSSGCPADRIAAALGPTYRSLWDRERPGVGLIFDHTELELIDSELLPLPGSGSVSWIHRTYLRGGIVSPRFAQLAAFRSRAGAAITAVNFHLQTAGAGRGGTEMRRQQIATIVDALIRRERARRIVACGDTNAFWWDPRQQLAMLSYILEPLAALGARDPERRPTHHFSRLNEPKLTHQIAVLLGRIGLDLPMRYDVVCTDLPVFRRGHERTPDSDHDLVWAAVEA
jgi:hypothetical protein